MYFSEEVNKMKDQIEDAFSVCGTANKDDLFSWMEPEAVFESDEVDGYAERPL